jgi:hypothetical protein
MPWQPSDAKAKTKKARTPKLKRKWSAVANAILAKTGNEGLAVKTANGVIKHSHKAHTMYPGAK